MFAIFLKFLFLIYRNILIKNNRLKVCDFDILKTLLNQKNKLKTTIPSPLYRAPDLIKNEMYNLKSDTW